MAAFSRLQLAAALLEYDNDPSNPYAPYRSSRESAIFAHVRRNNGPRPSAISRKSTDYLGVNLPSETGSVYDRESMVDARRSRGSFDALRNPFGLVDEEIEEAAEEEGNMDIDLASWGLDAFLKKDKGSKNNRNKAKSEVLPNPHPAHAEREVGVEGGSRPTYNRSMSMTGFDNFGVGGAFLETKSIANSDPIRRRSFGSPLDIAERENSLSRPVHARTMSSHALIVNMPPTPPLHSIPFPTKSPAPSELNLPGLMDEANNTLALRTSSDRVSGSDFKPVHARTMSNATMASMASKALLVDQNSPFIVRPPSPSRSSRFDPKAAAHARTMSNISLGTRANFDDSESVSGLDQRRERPYSRLELMRPKVLVMPSPLQNTMPVVSEPPKSREGFEVSTDGPPLPPGARSSYRASALLSPSVPVASNSFTPNPRMSLTLSQLTFRNSLMVDGQRDVAYSDIDERLPRATEEGERIQTTTPIPELPVPPVPVIVDEPESEILKRPAGKLYGKSLIDDLESRKAEMRGKQRVFTGDDRPSMMARKSLQRTSTLIDPASLQRPISQRMDSFQSQPELQRRSSVNAVPLLKFDEDDKLLSGTQAGAGSRVPKARSVFGVDTLWEREMAKLKDIELKERREAEERKKREEEEEARNSKKRKSRGKVKSNTATQEASSPIQEGISPIQRTSSSPPLLPVISATARRRPPPPDEIDSESESDSSSSRKQAAAARSTASPRIGETGWASDEEAGPIRTTGTGPRYRNRSIGHSENLQLLAAEDSDEDIPLAATLKLATQRAPPPPRSVSDSDEDQPLSTLLHKSLWRAPTSSLGLLGDDKRSADDDDDKPLGLRASRIAPSSRAMSSGKGDEDDDEMPLAFHPEHQRRTQYHMLAQQQQMMMQAQMHNSMFLGTPSMMSPGFFGSPMPPMMMPAPLPMVSAPPLHDANKFGRVDKWRHDVAVEGSQ